MTETFGEKATAALDWVAYATLLLAFPLLIAFAIDPVRVQLELLGIVSERSIIAVSALAVISTMFTLRAHTRTLADLKLNAEILIASIYDSQSMSGVVGPTNVAQSRVLARVRAVTDPALKEAHLIAQNLSGSVPVLIPILEDTELRDWKLHIYCSDPDGDDVRVPAEWRELVRTMFSMFAKRVNELRGSLANRHISIDVTYYRHVPVVHGVMLGDGSLVMTVAQWDNDGVTLADADFYDVIDAKDMSNRADNQRKLFRNWLTAARRRGQPVMLNNAVVADRVGTAA